ncbi:hypothetical protein [Azospirillum isscasi]|uniref:Uncharacterized protein n=1 Tax=Azospirillum isscasi TaxID=3053926 RepID=A0ABU0WQX7_9PROT|nr:hypothetical protein [Azospirillum isscasi]MDQ2106651.1 hypothetical protein [Azospirillum isscasi]
MTSEGANPQGAGRRGAVLVFDADDRLAAWNDEAAALPGAGLLLVRGALPEALAPLFRSPRTARGPRNRPGRPRR